ncbi:Fe2+-dependent dioxygenase [Pseudorhodoplanes sp.]|uniref:Fe2+-dependent dioxygenase n=1 Tax=Pseudorhodoplanes sp. TaxID=1934341 RepID=UPI003D0C8F15
MMVHIPGLLPPPEVAECRAILESSQWVDGRGTAGEQAAQAKFNLQIPVSSETAAKAGGIVLRALARNPAFRSATLPRLVLPPLFNRYDAGMRFDAHVDGAIRTLPGSGEQMRADISSTLFLTDPADYDGGDLVVEDTYGTHSVKLPAGDIVVYPATSLHNVTPITRGSRWASFFWVQSLIRDDGKRTLLYDLDTAIMEVRQRLGDHERASVALASHYHNLLRRWAEL